MKTKNFTATIILVTLWILPLHSGWAGNASDDLSDVYSDTEAFDGGPGSTVNTEPELTNPVGETPETGSAEPAEAVDTNTSTDGVKSSYDLDTSDSSDSEPEQT